MKYYIRKSKNVFFLYKETSFQSILTDLFSVLVWVSLIGMNMAFSHYVGRSWPLDIVVSIIMIMYVFTSFTSKKINVSKHYLRRELREYLDIETTKSNKTTPSGELDSIWSFVEMYYPNYYSSNMIANNEDLTKIINKSNQPGDDSDNLLRDEYGGDPTNPQILIDYSASVAEILTDAIEAHIAYLKKV